MKFDMIKYIFQSSLFQFSRNSVLKTRRLAFSGPSKFKNSKLSISEKQALNRIISYYEKKVDLKREDEYMNNLFHAEDELSVEERDQDLIDGKIYCLNIISIIIYYFYYYFNLNFLY